MLHSPKSIMLTRSVALAAALTVSAGLSGLTGTSAQARELSFSLSSSPKGALNNVQRWWADEIAKRTNGEVTVKFYYLQSLAKLSDALKAVQSGLADIATTVPAYSSKQLPVWYLASTAIGTGNQYVTTEAWRRVRDSRLEIKAEEKRNKVKYLYHYSVGPSVLLSKEKPYRAVADFAGQKIRLTSHLVRAAKAFKWDVTPVRIKFPEIYSALEKGVLDGAVSYINQIPVYKHNEVAKYVVEMDLGQPTLPVFMNLKAWNELTPAQQKVFDDLYPELMQRLARADLEESDKNRKMLRTDPKNPMTLVGLTADERAAWEKALSHSNNINIEKSSKIVPTAGDVAATYLGQINAVQAEVKQQGYPWGK